MKLVHALPLFSILFLAGCKKDTAVSTPNKDIITGGSSKSWLIKKVVATLTVAGNVQTTDVTNTFFQPCELDNYTTFNSDGSLLLNEGATKCNSSDPQIQNGTYALNADESKLTVSDGKASFIAKLSGVTATQFITSIDTTIVYQGNSFLSTTTQTWVPK